MSTNDPNAVLTPEQIVEQLRALKTQIADVTPLTPQQRENVRLKTRVPQPVVEASINVIGASEMISQAIGVPAAAVRQMLDDAARWSAVEGELRAVLNGVAGANLVRRQRIAIVTGQAYNLGKQLAAVPGQSELVPHVEEVKRLRKLSNRKKRTPEPPAPAPSPAVTEETSNQS